MKKTTKSGLIILTSIVVAGAIFASWTDLTSPQKQTGDKLFSNEWNAMLDNIELLKGKITAYASSFRTDTANLKRNSGETLTSEIWNATQDNIEYLKQGLENNTIVEVYGDGINEDENAIEACNKWVTDNTSGKGDWIWVPARYFETDGIGVPLTDNYYKKMVKYAGNIYVCKGFAVAMYEMGYSNKTSPDTSNNNGWNTVSYSATTNNNLVSKSGLYPIAEITQSGAIEACQSLGGGFHLITNNEWMAIARNIEQQTINWSGGSVGNGYISNGITNDAAHGCGGGTTKDTMYDSLTRARATKTGGGFGNDTCDNLRQLTLSNGAKIWDLAGNVREHVNKSNAIAGAYNSASFRVSNACGGNNWYSYSGNDGAEQCGWINSYTYSNVGPATLGLNLNNGIGGINSLNTSNNIFLRGGGASNDVNTGLFTLTLVRTFSTQLNSFGFRCVL